MSDIFKTQTPDVNINNSLPVARPGLIFILIGVFLILVTLIVEWYVPATIFTLLTAFCSWFFRDPKRLTPPEGFGLAPADGRIIKIEKLAENPYFDGPAQKISIFMSVFSVHVNRVSANGRLIKQSYFPGKFINASFDKASFGNERNALILETREGPIAMVQIAGLIARRIVTWVSEGEDLKRGQRFGLIRFGSRLDLYLPANAKIMVTIGQKVSAGWSPIWC